MQEDCGYFGRESMSFYFLTFLLLAAGTLITWFKPQAEEKVYWVCWAVMTACLCFRFGQGTDYVTMHALYNTIPAAVDLSQGYICGFYPEIGWRIISAAFKVFGAPFWVFTMVLGFVEMLMLHRFLKKYVPMKAAGLFMLYPVLFITYMVSGLRQGLAICFFLGVLVPFYLEKKWVRYVLGVFIAASFHRVGYAWLVLPIVYYLPMRVMTGLTGLSVLGGLILQVGVVEQFLAKLIPVYHIQQFLLEGEVSFFAAGERLISFVVICFLFFWYKKNEEIVDGKVELFIKAYMCGICFYMLLCGSSYYASRYCIIFKVLECVIVLILIWKKTHVANAVAVFFFCMTFLMGCKNLNAMIREGFWYDLNVVNIWNFPYVSIFNQDDILNYIPYEDKLEEIYGYNIGDQKLWMIEK